MIKDDLSEEEFREGIKELIADGLIKLSIKDGKEFYILSELGEQLKKLESFKLNNRSN